MCVCKLNQSEFDRNEQRLKGVKLNTSGKVMNINYTHEL